MGLLTILLVTSTILGSSNNAIQAYDYVTEPPFQTTSSTASTTPAVDHCKKDTEFDVQEAYNITQIIPLTIAKISKNVAKFYSTINSKSFQISNIDQSHNSRNVQTATLRHPSYHYEEYQYHPYNQVPSKLAVKKYITCEFSKFLKINMNTESRLEITGYYNITNNSTTLRFIPYLMRFAGIDISIFKTYNPADNTSSITETDIEIEYQDFKIELSGNDGEEFVALNTMSSLMQEIKSDSKMIFKKEIIHFFQSMQSPEDNIFTTCMQPKADITEKFANFSAHELDHYYRIANEEPDQWNIVMDQIIIRGLTNFKNFSLNTDSLELLQLNLSIENVSGYANWYYYNVSALNVKPSRLNFKIDRIYIETDLKKVLRQGRNYHSYTYSSSYYDSLPPSMIKIDAASVVCENSSDSLSSLASAILLEKTKLSVISSITESFRNIYNSYEFQHFVQDS